MCQTFQRVHSTYATSDVLLLLVSADNGSDNLVKNNPIELSDKESKEEEDDNVFEELQLLPKLRKSLDKQRSNYWEHICLLENDDVQQLKKVNDSRCTHYCKNSKHCNNVLFVPRRSSKGKFG